MRRGPFLLPLSDDFVGAGVYALFYKGLAPMYRRVQSEDATWPIYVGKAVPPGARKGGKQKLGDGAKTLHARLSEHTRSIEAAENLTINDFVCRYLVVTPLWITMAERFLIEHYRPVWNVCIEGFGNHDPGSGRHKGEIAWWDALHPGRAWARNLQQSRSQADAKSRLNHFLVTYERKTSMDALKAMPADSSLVAEVAQAHEEADDE